MTDTHLTQAGQYQIEILRKAKHNQGEIAALLGRDKSCISLELRRNRGQRWLPRKTGAFTRTNTPAGLHKRTSGAGQNLGTG